jgi:hypothetical protein
VTLPRECGASEAFWNDTRHMAGIDGQLYLVDAADVYRVSTGR